MVILLYTLSYVTYLQWLRLKIRDSLQARKVVERSLLPLLFAYSISDQFRKVNRKWELRAKQLPGYLSNEFFFYLPCLSINYIIS